MPGIMANMGQAVIWIEMGIFIDAYKRHSASMN